MEMTATDGRTKETLLKANEKAMNTFNKMKCCRQWFFFVGVGCFPAIKRVLIFTNNNVLLGILALIAITVAKLG